MAKKLSELPINPFEDNVVFEPRDSERAVRGLNDRPLEKLQKQFARLEVQDFPRTQPAFLKAQLVTSAEPGYGKSHLIGRLFKSLGGRATQVYVRPFQDAAASWRSILLRVVQELHRPGAVTHERETPTQLEAFAHGVIGRLLASLIKQKRIGLTSGDAYAVAKKLAAQPLHAFDAQQGWLATFSKEDFQRVLPLCAAELEESGLVFHTAPGAWLKVLFTYARSARHGEERAICLEWLKGAVPSEADAQRIGLTRLDATMLSPQEDSAAHRNEAAMRRVQDFCALAGFYRPFLFCFDQTELFTSEVGLVLEFGAVIDRLVSHGLNLMVVVTANLEPWTRLIKSHLQSALHDRFSDPIELEGMNEIQAGRLSRQRLDRWSVQEEEIDRFCDPVWLAEIFEEKKTCSVRAFLRRCARRCDEFAEHRPEIAPERTIEEFLQHYERELAAKTAALEFDPDILRWAVGPEVVGEALPVQPEKYVDAKRYFPIRWDAPEREVLFGFEESAHWKRWEAILNYSSAHASRLAGEKKMARVFFLRTGEQPAIPNENWQTLLPQFEAARGFLRVQTLPRAQVQRIYAAYELYANVIEGNAPFSREEMLVFLRAQLAPWWQELLGESEPAAAETKSAAPEANAEQLGAEIRRIVSRKAALNLDQLGAALSQPVSPERLLALCREIPEIGIFASAHATALKWTPKSGAR